MTPNEWRDRTIQVFRDLDSTELSDAAYQCAVYAANEEHPLHEAALDVFASMAGIDALVAANRRLAAERDDLRLQRDELLNAVEAWNDAEPELKQSPAFWICTMCGAANEAGERSCARCDRDSAADEAALRHG